jgi:hypothetical protein
VITGEYSSTEIIDLLTIQNWKNEITNYNQPSSKEIPEKAYLNQENKNRME